MKDAILTFIFIVGSIGTAALIQLPLYIGFAFGLFLVTVLVYRKGFSIKEIIFSYIDGLKRIRPVLFILALIGLLIPAWIISGTVPTMVFYIVGWIDPNWLLLFAFFITGITSFVLGTAIGTLGSLGIIIIGVAVTVDAPIALVAGALVSGALIGDRCSPLSSAFHLAANSVEVNTKPLFKNMLPSTLLIIAFCLVFYFLLGLGMDTKEVAENSVVNNLIYEYFHVSFLTIIPIIILFGSILLNVPTIPSLGLGVVSGIIVAIIVQQSTMLDVLQSIAFGYHHAPEGLEEVLRGGGVFTMLELFVFISLASMMNGLLDKTHLFKIFIEKMFEKAASLTNYTARTVVLGILFSIVGCNQSFPIMLTGSSLKNTWTKAGYRQVDLGRTVCDSALVVPGLVPWSMLAILSAAAIGVPTLDYMLYAAFLWSAPFITVLVSYIYSINCRQIQGQEEAS